MEGRASRVWHQRGFEAGIATDAGSVKASADSSQAALSHTDAIDAVHGGMRGSDIMALLEASGEVGAQVYTVDRPYQETQNSVARHLVLNPRELPAFIRHSATLLSAGGRQGTGGQGAEERCPAGIQEILGRQREQHMAREVAQRAVRGVDVLFLCTADRAEGMKKLLRDSEVAAVVPSSATRIWPLLLVLLYLLLPAYGSVLLGWKVSRALADALTASTKQGQVMLEAASAAPAPAAAPEPVPTSATAATVASER